MLFFEITEDSSLKTIIKNKKTEAKIERMAINVNGEVIQMHEQCVVEMQEGSTNLTKGYWKG